MSKTMQALKRHFFRPQTFERLKVNARNFSINIFEPDYLESMKSKLPLYNTLNIQLRGYDFCVLENYQKFLHNLIKNMDIDIEDAWAAPAQEMHVTAYKPNSEIVSSEYRLKTYERTVQVTDVTSLQLPIVLRLLESSAPEGVSVSVVQHEDYHDEVRFIPDRELNTLKQQLDDMGGPSKKK